MADNSSSTMKKATGMQKALDEAQARGDTNRAKVIERALRAKELKEKKDEELEIAKEVHEYNLWAAKEEGDAKKQIQSKIQKEADAFSKNQIGYITEKVAAVTKTITDKLDPIIDKYLNNIQSLNAHLVGTGRDLGSITNKLNAALSSQGFVRQEAVFTNLTNYVRDGITYNVEQRAFLKTMADDMSMVFDEWTGTMNQLVRIQRSDSTANRLALEFSLQEFLNQNYQTSEYIKDSFASVSNALITAQSTMTADNAMAFESTVQTWLGSLYSAGLNQDTIQSLATAINQLGSGDISGLGNGISNLVLMGAARAGLDYGAILNNGLNQSTTNQLLTGISGYLAEMGGYDSNVVRSQLGNIFGVSITDMIAANNLRETSGGVSSDISSLLGNYSKLMPGVTKWSNLFENMMYAWGTNIASNEMALGTYKFTELLAGTIGKSLEGVEAKASFLGLGGSVDVGKLIQASPLFALVPTLLETSGQMLMSGARGLFGGVEGIYNALANGTTTQGSTVKISDAGVSGSAYFGSNTSGGDLLSSSMTSMNDLLGNSSVVQSDEPTLEDNVATITGDVAIIVDLLTTHLESIDDAVHNMSLENTMYNYARDALTF